ncbi:MAG: hypothetical protein WBQ26_02995 [Gemmatimonadaceae bacterium]|nr:hypothetical protein [Gemmatimonadaceae bacterium]
MGQIVNGAQWRSPASDPGFVAALVLIVIASGVLALRAARLVKAMGQPAD